MFMRKKESVIIETKSIREILKLTSFDTVVIFDLDNTVMESTTELGSDQQFCQLVEHAFKTLPNKQEAIDAALDIYHQVQHLVRTKPVEPKIVMMIKALQHIGIEVLGLTLRGDLLKDTTACQLGEIDINFANTPHKHDVEFEFGEDKHKAFYHNHIIYCGGNDKGECLKAFLHQRNALPKHIMMIDDKDKHLQAVQKAADALDIPFHGIRYGHLDEKVQAIDMHKSHQQLYQIKHRLPEQTQANIDKLGMLGVEHGKSDTSYLKMFSVKPVVAGEARVFSGRGLKRK